MGYSIVDVTVNLHTLTGVYPMNHRGVYIAKDGEDRIERALMELDCADREVVEFIRNQLKNLTKDALFIVKTAEGAHEYLFTEIRNSRPNARFVKIEPSEAMMADGIFCYQVSFN